MMTATSRAQMNRGNVTQGRGRIFGVPMGDFGIFASLLLAFSIGFLSFFAATFLAIFGIMIYNGAAHKAVNYADSYRLIGFPVGVLVLLAGLVFFGTMWVRRKFLGN